MSVRARLVLLAVSGPLVTVHRMAAERAAGILAVVLMQARQEEELAARGAVTSSPISPKGASRRRTRPRRPGCWGSGRAGIRCCRW